MSTSMSTLCQPKVMWLLKSPLIYDKSLLTFDPMVILKVTSILVDTSRHEG
jgi:hypothetical protein